MLAAVNIGTAIYILLTLAKASREASVGREMKAKTEGPFAVTSSGVRSRSDKFMIDSSRRVSRPVGVVATLVAAVEGSPVGPKVGMSVMSLAMLYSFVLDSKSRV